MKKNLYLMFVGLVVAMGAILASCTNAKSDKRVDTFVEQLNSDAFQEQVAKTGIFTEAEGTVDGDSLVVLTFKTIPGLSFKHADQKLMDVQKIGWVETFKKSIPVDKVLREGFEGMQANDMVFRFVFVDVNGDSAAVDIQPSEVLE